MFAGGKKERQRLEAIADLEHTFHEQLRPRSSFAVTLPLAQPSDIERRRVVQAVRTFVEEAGGEFQEHEINRVLDGLQREPSLLKFGKPQPEHQMFAFWLGGVGVAAILAPVRLKDIEGLASFFSPSDWEWVGRDVKRHQAHVGIYEFGFDGPDQPKGRDAAFNRAAAATSVAVALGEELEAQAVCWNSSSNALRPEGLASAREDLVRGHAPVDLWVRIYRTLANPGEHPGVISSGLAPFTGFEVEVASSPTDVRVAQNFLHDVLVDLLDRDATIAHGDVVKKGEEAARAELTVERDQKLCRFTFVEPWEI